MKHKLPSASRGTYRIHMYLSERIKFFRISELMDVYGGKVCRESLVAAEFAFSDGDNDVNDCAFAKFVNTTNGVALDSVLIKVNAVPCLRFYVETRFVTFFRRNPLCFCGGILTKLFDNFFKMSFC